MSPLSNQLTVFELEALNADGLAGAADPDLDQEDRDGVESRSVLEIALPGRW